MGLLTPKRYMQRDRATGKMKWVTPDPIEVTTKRMSVPTGSRHGRMPFFLIEKLSGK
jgi:hypothetical protein